MNEADELILAVSKDTAKVKNGKYREDELGEEGNDGHRHEVLADIEMVALHMLQLLRELCLLLHVARFLFASPIPHFLANVIDSILIHRVVLLEEAYSLLTIAAVVAISTAAAVATTPRTTFVWVFGASGVMTLARKA